jgi:hypothetical protein
MILKVLSSNMIGEKKKQAFGKSGRDIRRKPKAPSLSKMPARITEPAVGAYTCASGSQT